MESKVDVKYSKVRTKEELFDIGKSFLTYVGIVVVWMFTVNIYRAWGRVWLLPAISTMWIMGAITSFKIAEERDETIKQTKYAILGYCLFLILYRWTIQKIVPVTSSQMGASLNISVPSASGMAASGLMQNLVIWLSLTIPIGFLGWCGQKFKVFKGRSTKEDEFNKLKGYVSDRRIR